MTLSKTTTKQITARFDQNNYNNVFYYCDKEHPFIAFTTCFCPLCDSYEHNRNISDALEETEEYLEKYTEKYETLYIKAKNLAPEILL